jgi:hypothetical protein
VRGTGASGGGGEDGDGGKGLVKTDSTPDLGCTRSDQLMAD